MLEAKDVQGVLAIMPTPAKDGADSLEAVETVDLDETARLAESLVRDGVSGIMGASGYCKPGPIRPPYDVMPEDFAEGCRESGRRFAELRTKYAQPLG